jgi:hypothetical protein
MRRWAEGSDVGVIERAAEGILAMLERVVSGGQTGADQAGRRTSPSESSGTRSASPATARRTRRVTGAAAVIPTAPVGGVRLPSGAGNLEIRTPLDTPGRALTA